MIYTIKMFRNSDVEKAQNEINAWLVSMNIDIIFIKQFIETIEIRDLHEMGLVVGKYSYTSIITSIWYTL
uniref:Uncharacterized protein n=1 Tax=viral metagenome TaxID=1070528 RepID=A0A6H1ZR13_9ZZZZ